MEECISSKHMYIYVRICIARTRTLAECAVDAEGKLLIPERVVRLVHRLCPPSCLRVRVYLHHTWSRQRPTLLLALALIFSFLFP